MITATLTPAAKPTGLTHWSARALAKKLKIGNATVARIWREHGIQPWRSEGFRFSTDPELEAKVIDIVGLYLDPPENAMVLCVHEESQSRSSGKPGVQRLQRRDTRLARAGRIRTAALPAPSLGFAPKVSASLPDRLPAASSPPNDHAHATPLDHGAPLVRLR